MKMKIKEVNQIIENYRPHKGFYDLTERPKTLTKVGYAELIKIQEYLSWQEGNKEYLKKFEPIQWQRMRELSANYQAIVLEYWV